MPEKKAARRFRRVRSDHASETAQDYVEAVAEVMSQRGECRGADLARLFGVSHVTVSKTVARLQGEGLLASVPYGPVALTPRGEALAAAAAERHDLVLRFLLALGVDAETAEADAEGIEHHVSEATLRRFKAFAEGRLKP